MTDAPMPGRVVVYDDSLRQTQGMVADGRLLFVKDRQHRKIQDVTSIARVLEGRPLEHAIRRARRWLHRPRNRRPPGHIALFLAAFHKADPAGFEAAVRGTRT